MSDYAGDANSFCYPLEKSQEMQLLRSGAKYIMALFDFCLRSRLRRNVGPFWKGFGLTKYATSAGSGYLSAAEYGDVVSILF